MKWVTNGILVAALLVAAVPTRAQQFEPRPTIGVHVINAAHITEPALRQAEEAVTRIYRAIGADTEWTFGTSNGVQLTIVIASPAMAERCAHAPGALGLTPSNPWDRGRQAYVFAASVEDTAHASGLSMPNLLGHAIAHEMGHMLLPQGHSEQGLMRPTWDSNDFRLASRGWLRFTPEQGKLIHANLVSRAHLCDSAQSRCAPHTPP